MPTFLARSWCMDTTHLHSFFCSSCPSPAFPPPPSSLITFPFERRSNLKTDSAGFGSYFPHTLPYNIAARTPRSSSGSRRCLHRSRQQTRMTLSSKSRVFLLSPEEDGAQQRDAGCRRGLQSSKGAGADRIVPILSLHLVARTPFTPNLFAPAGVFMNLARSSCFSPGMATTTQQSHCGPEGTGPEMNPSCLLQSDSWT